MAKKQKLPIKRPTTSAFSKSKKLKSTLNSDEHEHIAGPSTSQELEPDEENNELDVLKERIEQLVCSNVVRLRASILFSKTFQ